MSSSSAALKVKPLQNTVGSVMRVAKENKKLLVLEFTAQSSGPCQEMKTVVEDVAGEVESMADIYEVDVDQYKSMARRLGVETQRLPTFLVVKGKYVVDRVVGPVVVKEELVRSIQTNKVE